jgi:hypothetical protein
MHRCWRFPAAAWAAALGLVLALAGDAGAVDPWLSVRGRGTCTSSAELLGSRIASARIGRPAPGLRAEVQLDGGAAVSATVRLLAGSRRIGSKRLVAQSCEELRDAVVAVLALALSSEQGELHPAVEDVPVATQPKQPTSCCSSGAPAASEPPSLGGVADSALASARTPLLRATRLSLAVGVDMGSLAESTAVLRVAVAARLRSGELRVAAWYGLPFVREQATDHFESVRADFAALGLDYCHGIDAERWLSACAGLELGLRRTSELRQAPDRERFERERVELEAGAVLGLALAYRAAWLQPQLDLSVQRPLVGGLAGAAPLGLRATFGAALPF